LDNVLQGVYIGIIGMGVLFASLGLLIGLISLLNRLFRLPMIESSAAPAVDDITADQQQELAVALAVAICLLDQGDEYDPSLGQRLECPPGGWWRGRDVTPASGR
jgi:Na+-transporting methylmalonyl-CoA/oxaloacetate decarboxylase gamma subunit